MNRFQGIILIFLLKFCTPGFCNPPPIKTFNYNSYYSQPLPHADNTTVAKAMALARQFLTPVVKEVNIDEFGLNAVRDQGSLKSPREANPEKKMYSWWTKTPTPDSVVETETVAELVGTEKEEMETESIKEEETPSTMIPEVEMITMIPMTTERDRELIGGMSWEKRETSSIAMEMETTTTEITTIGTLKPASTSSKPPKPKPTVPPTSASHIPPKQEDTATTTFTDPLGVKAKLGVIVRGIGNHTQNTVNAVNQRINPIIHETARQSGILVLKAVGRVGNLTKNAANDYYQGWAKRLNISEEELQDGPKKGVGPEVVTTAAKKTPGPAGPDDVNSHKEYEDEEESCGAGMSCFSNAVMIVVMIITSKFL